MASKIVRDGRSPQRPAESHDISEPEAVAETRRKRRKREANVYDAVAGRVTSTLPLDDFSDSEGTPTHHRRPPRRDRHRDPTLAPEEVLFRRIGAPVRFAEKDIYRAHEALPDEGRGVLPDSDMLKAVHSYASHFYAALNGPGEHDDAPPARGSRAAGRRKAAGKGKGEGKGKGKGNVDEQSMDETALLAFGILLEEAGREILGKKGDLVFTEGVEVDANGEPVEGDLGPVGFNEAGRWRRQRAKGAARKGGKREGIE